MWMRGRDVYFRGVGRLAALAALVLCVCPAHAVAGESIDVTDTAEDIALTGAKEGPGARDTSHQLAGCTLRAAVELADLISTRTGEGITVDVPSGTFLDSLGTLTITKGAQVTLAGQSANYSAIDGALKGSVLTVEQGAGLTLRDLTLQDGHATNNGGGIYVEGASTLIVERSTLAHNTAEENGGAIAFYGTTPARYNARPTISSITPTLEEFAISQSTIAHNTAEGDGGGIYYQRSPNEISLRANENVILNTTIADNQAKAGGGIYIQSAFLPLTSDTVFDNRDYPVQAAGNNLATTIKPRGELLLRSTILAEPQQSGLENCAGLIYSLGYNLDDPSTLTPGQPGHDHCGMSTNGPDLLGLDPLLDPEGLQYNGGPTETLRLLADAQGPKSPAITAVPTIDCDRPLVETEPVQYEPLTTDQRGSNRPSTPTGDCSIGAYEYSPTTLTPTCTIPNPVNPGE